MALRKPRFFFISLSLLLFVLSLSASEVPYIQDEKWMQSIQVVEGAWIESETDLSSGSLELKRCFCPTSRKSAKLAYGWSFNLPDLLGTDLERRRFDHPDLEEIRFEHDVNSRLISLFHEKKRDKITLSYDDQGFTAESAQGDSVRYTLALFAPDIYVLTKVARPGAPATLYSYASHPTLRQPLLTEKKTEGGESLHFSYWNLPEEGPRSFKTGKLKEIRRKPAADEAPILLCTLDYAPELTTVKYSSGLILYYHFNQMGEITTIETHLSQTSGLYRSQKFEWKNGRMTAKSVRTAEGKEIFREEFLYNASGQLASETIKGCLTALDAPCNESFTSLHQYSIEGRLLQSSNDNGKKTRYVYSHKGKRPNAKLLMEQDKVLLRSSYKYSTTGDLIEEWIDDLDTLLPLSTVNPTRRLFKAYARTGPFNALQEETSGYEEISTGERIVTEKKVYTVNAKGQTLTEEHYDQEGKLQASARSEYDVFGRLQHFTSGQKTIDYQYDPYGHLFCKITYSDENETRQYYRPGEILVREETYETDKIPRILRYQYDSFQRVETLIDQCGNTTHFTYDPLGRKIGESCSNGKFTSTVQYMYDEMDRMVKYIDPLGFETEVQYNARGQVLQRIYPDGTREIKEYALDGKLLKEIAKDGLITHYEKDCQDRIVQKQLFSSSGMLIKSESYRYGAFDLQSCQINESCTSFQYDGLGRTVEEFNETEGLRTQYFYTSQSKIKRDWIGSTYVDMVQQNDSDTLRLLDEKGALLLEQKAALKTPGVSQEVLHQESTGRSYIIQECLLENGCVKKQKLDAQEKPIEEWIEKPDGTLAIRKEYRYDPNGNLIYLSAGNTTIEWHYGPGNRLEWVLEAGAKTSYTYNRLGQLTAITKPDGTLLIQEFDDASRLKRFYSSDQSVDYILEYNSAGQIERVHNLASGRSTSRVYSKEGRMVGETLENGLTIRFSYDCQGRKQEISLPDGSLIRHQYKNLFLTKVERCLADGSLLYTHAYNAYNTQGNPLEQELICGSGTLLCSYDTEGRMLSTSAPFYEQKALYDTQGNVVKLNTKEGTNERSETFSYDAMNQLLPCNSTCTTEFDLNGNLTLKEEDGIRTQYYYDALNRLTEVKYNGNTIFECTYDALHRRIQSKDREGTRYYLYDGNNEIGSYNEQGLPLEIRILGRTTSAEGNATVAIEKDGNIYAALHDLQGSICGLIDISSKALHSCSYTPYGKASDAGSFASPWGYAGKRKDSATGLIFYGRRYYDPSLCQWTTKDPLGFPDGAERRLFMQNNPLRYKDAYGLFSTEDTFEGIWALGQRLFEQAKLKVYAAFAKMRDYTNMGMKQILHNLVGNGFLLLLGFYKTEADKGLYGRAEVNDKVRVSFINGILTDYASLYSTLQGISGSHGNTCIHYVYRPTKGWVWDILHSFLVKLGYTSPYAEELAKEWKKMIYEMGGVNGGGVIIHYAHSIGAVESIRALSLLSPEEQKMVRMYAFGSPELTSKGGLAEIHHFISVRDGVPLLDPIGFLGAIGGGKSNILFVGSFFGVPLIDHLFGTQCYQDIWRAMGRTFVEWYGSV